MLNIFEQEEMIPHEFWFLPGIPLMVKSNEDDSEYMTEA